MACYLKMLLYSSLLLFLSSLGFAQSCTGVLGNIASAITGVSGIQGFCASNFPASAAGTVLATASTSTTIVGTAIVTSTVTSTSTVGITTVTQTSIGTTTVTQILVLTSPPASRTVSATVATVTVTAVITQNNKKKRQATTTTPVQLGNNARLLCGCILAGQTVTVTPTVTSSITATLTSFSTSTISVAGTVTVTQTTLQTSTVVSITSVNNRLDVTVTLPVTATVTVTSTSTSTTSTTTSTTTSSSAQPTQILDYSCTNIGKLCNGGQAGSCYCQYEAQTGQGVCVSLNDRSNSIRCTSTAGCPSGQRCITGTSATTTNGFCYPVRAQCARVNSAKFLFARKLKGYGDY